MRKLYTLITGLCLLLTAMFTYGRTSVDSCRANFEVSTSSASPLVKKFTAFPWHSNQNRPVVICWEFGDGSDTCIEYSSAYTGPYHVEHTYPERGEYEVCVKILYQGGCEATKCKLIRVGEICKADFERVLVNVTSVGWYTVFKALPWHSENKKPTLICWEFGDNKDTCIEYPENYTGVYTVLHRYREPGNYEVCVRIRYAGGCEADKCKLVQIGTQDSCRADFLRLPTVVGSPLSVKLKALPYHSSNKKPKKICWKFGDGRDTCIEYGNDYSGLYTVNHTYSQPGHYNVCVRIVYVGGCTAEKCRVIGVGNPDECRIDFERIPIATPDSGRVVGFRALPFHNNGKRPRVICWSFGDGQDTCVEYAQNFAGPYIIRHRYQHPGNYEVCVKAIYYGGCEARKCKLVSIEFPAFCRADFERLNVSPTTNPLHVTFKALPWHYNNKKPKVICWKFGDGKDTCIEYPEDYNGPYIVGHTYPERGKYEVCIKIIYYGGCEARKCREIIIEPNAACRVRLFEITPSINSLTRGFHAAPLSSPERRPVRICWNFGDGSDTCINLGDSVSPSQGLFIRHTFPAPGVYRVCVKILFEGGCTAHDCREVVIRMHNNVCGGFMTDSLTAPRSFKFKAFPVHNNNDTVIGYRWSFGDGASATGREVTHTYASPGIYEVCVLIKTEHGCETRICKKLVVPGNNQPVLLLSPNPVTSVLHIQFYSTHTEQVNIRIINGNGLIVRNITRNTVAGLNHWDLEVNSLPAGTYTVVVQSSNQLSSAVFIKI